MLLWQSAGCVTLVSPHWATPAVAKPDFLLVESQNAVRSGGADLMQAELAYAAAHRALDNDCAECVDEFYRTAELAWTEIEKQLKQTGCSEGRALELYHSALHSIVQEGQRFQRFNPQSGLMICVGDSWLQVPIHHRGFVRAPQDFSTLLSVGNYTTKELNNVYRCCGLGVPTIVSRVAETTEDFQRKRSVFPATLLLRSMHDEGGVRSFAFELYDPIRITSVEVNAVAVPLMRDTSAPIARALAVRERNYIRAFLQPGSTNPEQDGLFMVEPYQPGKIPIIFVHGLLSDRLTWANMLNEFAARREIMDRFQTWSFEYPTGEPFVKSAALLRRELQQLLERVDPQQSDPALKQIVLVGHSMGGLISTMQITRSGEYLWNSISMCPFDETLIPPAYRPRLREAFFFEPSPAVSRVVYIGTPHRGSSLATRMIGRASSLLVEESSELTEAHRQMIDDNPNVFTPEFSRRIPTSIDLLDPSSQVLYTVRTLPKACNVQFHSIIGDNCCLPGIDTDGVVPVSSASLSGAVSEKLVNEKHTQLTRDPSVIEELLGILAEHLRCLEGRRD